MGFAVQRIAAGAVVVARDIQAVQEGRAQRVHLFGVAGLVHAAAHEGRHDVEGEAGVLSFLFGLALSAACRLLAVLVNALAFGGLGQDHQVRSAGDGTRRVEMMAEVYLRAPRVDAFLFKGLRDLVTDGVENDAGVVEVPLHHGGGIFLPVFRPVAAVVIGILAVVPHVEALVHDVHAQRVAGLQHGAGCGIVCGADGVEAVFLQDPHAPPFALVIGRRAEDAVIVMDAAAAQKRLFPVDEQALAAPCDLTDAEGDLHRVALTRAYPCGVEVRRLGAPQSGVRDRQFKARSLAENALDLGLDGDGGFDCDDRRVDGYSADLYALGAQPVLLADMEPHRPIDAGAGVPTGVGQLGVVRHDSERVLPADGQPGQLHKEIGIAVGMEAELLSVQADGRVLVYALKLRENGFALPLGGGCEGFLIGIYAAGEIAVPAVGGIGAAFLGDLRVVGKTDRHAVTQPITMKRNRVHTLLLVR